MTATRQRPAPDTAATPSQLLAAPVTATLITSAVWVGLCSWSPTTTWHLAPGLVAAAAAITARYRSADPLQARIAAALSVLGFAVAAIVTIGLTVSGRLAGPTVIDRGSPAAEAVVVAAIAALWGLRSATRQRSPWWLRLTQGTQP